MFPLLLDRRFQRAIWLSLEFTNLVLFTYLVWQNNTLVFETMFAENWNTQTC